MSALANPRTRRVQPTTGTKRLRLVAPARATTRRTPFVVVVILIISLGLVGLILISTILQGQAFTLDRLDRQATELQTKQEAMTHALNAMQSPAGLAAAAVGYGMVPNTNPVFLRLSDGSIIGKADPARPGTNVKQVNR